ncbi:hypothetical protein [Azorhizobium doebereinerae]|uniref:hypothetical protein n=1 Tax=Azorhizobium doebereinerae TaxID=281091 RepID=UPI00040B6399|nr:hypothetical protein [Azorhizobium doebereinerae]
MSGQVLVRLSPALAAAVSAAALSADLSAGAWLRHLAAEGVGQPDQARPTKPVDAAPDPLVAELGLVARNVGRMNGALVQLAKTMRETLHPDHAASEQVLARLRAAQRELIDLVQEVRRDRGRHEG